MRDTSLIYIMGVFFDLPVKQPNHPQRRHHAGWCPIPSRPTVTLAQLVICVCAILHATNVMLSAVKH